MPNTSPLAAGLTLQNRYRIVRELGRGGFGRTYLAQDIHQSSEYCVLKEFAPEVQGTNELQKAKELFERESGVLYKLQHPQIPRFRELLRVNMGGSESLFLVQDYVEGQNYFELLKLYKKQGRQFSEAEVTQLLFQMLPVLEYIHSLGVVHRDISPDNLIQRSSDRLPILIDFGAVKQAAVTAVSLYSRLRPLTRIGKEGYAPDEQMLRGQALPCSDLYALAVTVLVLLTGKEPYELYDTSKATWRWRQEVNVSRTLGVVLDRMLAYRPRDRYQSAREVILALQAGDPKVSQMRTINFLGSISNPTHQSSGSNSNRTLVIANSTKKLLGRHWKIVAISMGITLFVGITAAALVKSGITSWRPSISLPLPPGIPARNSEQDRPTKILKRVQALKISEAAFYRQVDKLFYAQHPELQGRSLTDKPEDAKLRQQWYQIAEDLLDKLEKRTNL
ncbi:MAG: serine/threonine protein kinase [Aphanothece sp. CMT-3BRIN-NPC111]|jgi:serine/threonine-protein kinase|nr:serine/threonine protein kinase [Aphanothece sp. CMT-3BRIN-NPC111]